MLISVSEFSNLYFDMEENEDIIRVKLLLKKEKEDEFAIRYYKT